ncbi:MAG: bifunctional sulfate adenylyltransferase subunit 1/adenylylsulfate kinase, partial [Candidatus Pacebacteria bacterium]|nr:bifunctional sulfate adenylyltransferase subunit 1/adenylylsulfate kinase [Candidatus Paceibacterota bacterium]
MKEKYNFNAELLRMVIAGSVDDGKSTFIGRLFYDLQEIYDDQLEALEKSSLQQGKKEIDLSFFTDGLSAEREQKITIDVAYRYLSTLKRRFIIADVPGHEQYTPNMVTGASNASLALILVDARKGILPQSKRHLFIASLMGVSHILVVINKMDLVDYDQNVFEKIKSDFLDFTTKLNITDLQFIPASSLNGDMIVRRGENMNWHQGSTIISYLENLEIASDRNLIDFRFPVQLVIRPNQDFRGYAGQVEGGKISVGEKVMILPSEKKTTIKSIIIGNKRKSYAFNSQAAVLSLKDDLDISRGDVIVGANNLAELGNEFEAMVCWMSDKPMRKGGSYILKQMTKTTRCFIDEVLYRININNLHRKRTNALKFNEIGRVCIKTNEPIVFDPYHKNKNTGS